MTHTTRALQSSQSNATQGTPDITRGGLVNAGCVGIKRESEREEQSLSCVCGRLRNDDSNRRAAAASRLLFQFVRSRCRHVHLCVHATPLLPLAASFPFFFFAFAEDAATAPTTPPHHCDGCSNRIFATAPCRHHRLFPPRLHRQPRRRRRLRPRPRRPGTPLHRSPHQAPSRPHPRRLPRQPPHRSPQHRPGQPRLPFLHNLLRRCHCLDGGNDGGGGGGDCVAAACPVPPPHHGEHRREVQARPAVAAAGCAAAAPVGAAQAEGGGGGAHARVARGRHAVAGDEHTA